MSTGVYQKLQAVQAELKAPKGQYNSFGKYKYRSCEDILEALKPVLAKHKAAVTIDDEIVQIGDRYYVRAAAWFYDIETGDTVRNTAYAREATDKKGMDESQITGTASSYARKYALNGLFLIDDTKDADTDSFHEQTQPQAQAPQTAPQVNKEAFPPKDEMLKAIYGKYPLGSKNYAALVASFNVQKIEDATDAQIQAVYTKVTKK